MRCYCCNRKLSDFESTRRSATTGEFLDMCNKCLIGLNIATVDRPDLEGSFEKHSDEEDSLDVYVGKQDDWEDIE